MRSARGDRVDYLGEDEPMSASMQKAEPSPRSELERAIVLLNEALNIVDEIADRPDIGARLQHVIETLQERSD
jgi:hypothetical protein